MKRAYIIFAILGLIVVVAGSVWPGTPSVLRGGRISQQKMNINYIGSALQQYAREHAGFYPESVHSLELQNYISDSFLSNTPKSMLYFRPSTPNPDPQQILLLLNYERSTIYYQASGQEGYIDEK